MKERFQRLPESIIKHGAGRFLAFYARRQTESGTQAMAATSTGQDKLDFVDPLVRKLAGKRSDIIERALQFKFMSRKRMWKAWPEPYFLKLLFPDINTANGHEMEPFTFQDNRLVSAKGSLQAKLAFSVLEREGQQVLQDFTEWAEPNLALQNQITEYRNAPVSMDHLKLDDSQIRKLIQSFWIKLRSARPDREEESCSEESETSQQAIKGESLSSDRLELSVTSQEVSKGESLPSKLSQKTENEDFQPENTPQEDIDQRESLLNNEVEISKELNVPASFAYSDIRTPISISSRSIPISEHYATIIKSIRDNPVTIISAEAGAGKVCLRLKLIKLLADHSTATISA